MYQRSWESFRIPDQPSSPQIADRNPPPPGLQFTSRPTTSKELAGFQVVDTDDWHAGYLLVARPEFGPGLASTPLADDDLVPDRATSTLDGATQVLASAAAIVDATLDLRDAAQPAFSPRPAAPGQTRWGQAFRSSADSATSDAAGPARAVPDPPAPTRTPRAR